VGLVIGGAVRLVELEVAGNDVKSLENVGEMWYTGIECEATPSTTYSSTSSSRPVAPSAPIEATEHNYVSR
jgi:hypothetical protein